MSDLIIKIKKLDWFYFSLIFFLSFVGFVMIYSATSGMEYNVLFSHSIKIILGLFVMLIVAITDLEFWKKNAFYLYFIFMVLLIWASFYGHIGKGSRRWINFSGFYIQPSEFMKICIILTLAKFFDEKKIKETRDYFFLILPITLVLVPFGLIVSQPDLGTASMILFISFIIFFISALSWKFFASIGIGFLIIALNSFLNSKCL